MPLWLYAAFCIGAPALWAFAMCYGFALVDARRRHATAKGARAPVDYSI